MKMSLRSKTEHPNRVLCFDFGIALSLNVEICGKWGKHGENPGKIRAKSKKIREISENWLT